MCTNLTALLMAAWGDEWEQLTPAQKARVVGDFQDAQREDGTESSGYVRLIGRGNLASYARSLEAGMGVHRV